MCLHVRLCAPSAMGNICARYFRQEAPEELKDQVELVLTMPENAARITRALFESSCLCDHGYHFAIGRLAPVRMVCKAWCRAATRILGDYFRYLEAVRVMHVHAHELFGTPRPGRKQWPRIAWLDYSTMTAND